MARVRDSEPTAPRRFVWATAGLAAAIVCGVIAIAFMNRTATPSIADRGVRLKPDATAGLPALVELPAPTDRQSVSAIEPASQAALPVARRRTLLRLPPDDPSTIEAITTEPLVLPSIDLPPIENQAASVERLEIEELTIEPLTASND